MIGAVNGVVNEAANGATTATQNKKAT